MKHRGLAQIPLMIGLLLMAIAVPVATKLVQNNQDTRNMAAGVADSPKPQTLCATYSCVEGQGGAGPSCNFAGYKTVNQGSPCPNDMCGRCGGPTGPAITVAPTKVPTAVPTKPPQTLCATYSCVEGQGGAGPSCNFAGYKTVNQGSPCPNDMCGRCGGPTGPAITVAPTKVPTAVPTKPPQTLCATYSCVEGQGGAGPSCNFAGYKTVNQGSPCPNDMCGRCGGPTGPAITVAPTKVPPTPSLTITSIPPINCSCSGGHWSSGCGYSIAGVDCGTPTVIPTIPCETWCDYACGCSSYSCTGGTPADSCPPTTAPKPTIKPPKPTTKPPIEPTTRPTVRPTDPPITGCNECPSTFACYKNGEEYKWFANGMPMVDFTKMADSSCSGVTKPTFKGKTKGDANCDGYIDVVDYSLWHKEFFDGGKGAMAKSTWNADFTGSDGKCDGRVDTYDFSLWQKYFNELKN